MDATQAMLVYKGSFGVLTVSCNIVTLSKRTLTGPSERTGVLNYGHGGESIPIWGRPGTKVQTSVNRHTGDCFRNAWFRGARSAASGDYYTEL